MGGRGLGGGKCGAEGGLAGLPTTSAALMPAATAAAYLDASASMAGARGMLNNLLLKAEVLRQSVVACETTPQTSQGACEKLAVVRVSLVSLC